MNLKTALLAAAVGLVGLNGPAAAVRDPGKRPLQSETIEVLVFETESCLYCRVFRRDVVPQYRQSKRAKVAPLRFVDAHKADLDRLGLKRPVTIVPTVVVLRDGREAGRINGYMGPEPFFHMMSQIVRSVP